MNNRLASIFFLVSIVTITGCQFFNSNDKEDNASKILHSPPFASLTDSIEKFPGQPALYLERADLLSQKNLPDLAYLDYKKSWSIHPDQSTALAYTASLFMTARETEAIKLLQECIKKFPENREFPRRLSEAYVQTGKSREALAQFNKLVEADSNNFEALYEKGVLLAELKDTLPAIRALERSYSLQPLQLVGISLANLYAETRDSKAVTLCNQLISKDSARELTDAVFIKGIYFANTGQHNEALEQFEDCINRDWKFTEAYIEKGILLYKEDNLDEALKTFALAARVSNTYADAYYWMGKCYEKIGKREEARDSYERAVALDKTFNEARESLNRLK